MFLGNGLGFGCGLLLRRRGLCRRHGLFFRGRLGGSRLFFRDGLFLRNRFFLCGGFCRDGLFHNGFFHNGLCLRIGCLNGLCGGRLQIFRYVLNFRGLFASDAGKDDAQNDERGDQDSCDRKQDDMQRRDGCKHEILHGKFLLILSVSIIPRAPPCLSRPVFIFL